MGVEGELVIYLAANNAGCWRLRREGFPIGWIMSPDGMRRPCRGSFWRKPDHTFQPWYFGDPEQKKTCLWTGGGFVMPEPTVRDRPSGVRQSVWRMAPSPERGDLRSVTPAGFARAVFEANAAQPAGKVGAA